MKRDHIYNQDPYTFKEEVYAIVRAIPAGRVTTYGAIAKALGYGRLSRQVGMILSRSHSDTPAHRVVNRVGLLTGKHHFGEGRMQELLEREGVQVSDDKVVAFNRLFWDPSIELLDQEV